MWTAKTLIRLGGCVDLSLRWAHMTFCWFGHEAAHLPPKPKSTFRHLKQGIQDFHRKYVLVPADKAANNVVVV